MLNKKIVLYIALITLLPSIVLASQLSQSSIFNGFHLRSSIGSKILKNESSTTFATPNNSTVLKSPNEAFLYSMIIPGLGQINNGAKYGYIYTAAEVGLLTTFFILRNNAANTREEYRDIVREHVIFIGPGNFEKWDPIEDFEHATQYDTWKNPYCSDESDAECKSLERTGKWYWDDMDPKYHSTKYNEIPVGAGSQEHRLQAFELRKKANDRFQTAKTVLGVVILNHLVSAVEARINTIRYNNQHLQNNSFEIETNTDISSGSITGVLVFKKRF